jgi:hypothetical protein
MKTIKRTFSNYNGGCLMAIGLNTINFIIFYDLYEAYFNSLI